MAFTRVATLLLLFLAVSPAFAAERGKVVAAKYGEEWWLATVVNAGEAGTCDVVYADGDEGRGLAPDRVRELSGELRVGKGASVLAAWNGRAFAPGTVAEVCRDCGRSYRITWADGSEPAWVPALHVLLEAEAGLAGEPGIGGPFELDGERFVVAGAGKDPYTYVASGESLVFLCLDDRSFKAVLVPGRGVEVAVDPSGPSVRIGGEEQLANREYWPQGAYVLLEYAQ